MRVQQTSNNNFHKNPNFGMNFNFTESFYEEASKIGQGKSQELKDVFLSLNKREGIASDNRLVQVFANGIKAIDEHLGNIHYQMDLNEMSIEKAVNSAYLDKVLIESLPNYAKIISNRLGINLNFSTKKAFFVAGENPYQKCKGAIDSVAEKLTKFPDKNAVSADICHENTGNTFDLKLQKGNSQQKANLFIDGESEPEEIGKRVDSCYRALSLFV